MGGRPGSDPKAKHEEERGRGWARTLPKAGLARGRRRERVREGREREGRDRSKSVA